MLGVKRRRFATQTRAVFNDRLETDGALRSEAFAGGEETSETEPPRRKSAEREVRRSDRKSLVRGAALLVAGIVASLPSVIEWGHDGPQSTLGAISMPVAAFCLGSGLISLFEWYRSKNL
jgi:hypothetical protein